MILLFAIVGVLTLGGCTTDNNLVSTKVSEAADNFVVPRRIVFYNGALNQNIFTIEGYCSIEVDEPESQLEVTCRTGGGYAKHFLGLSDSVSYFVMQISREVAKDHYIMYDHVLGYNVTP